MAKINDQNQAPMAGLTPELETIVRALAAIMPQQNMASNPRFDNILSKIDESLEIAKQDRIKKETEDAEKRRVDIESRKQNAMAMELKKQMQVAAQSQCLHRQPNMDTNVIGQRGHFGNIHWFCQECSKYWKDSEIPENLKPRNRNMIGGVI